jgi:hypothetical protein
VTVIPLFPRSGPVDEDPDFSWLSPADIAAILAVPWAAAITGLDRLAGSEPAPRPRHLRIIRGGAR